MLIATLKIVIGQRHLKRHADRLKLARIVKKGRVIRQRERARTVASPCRLRFRSVNERINEQPEQDQRTGSSKSTFPLFPNACRPAVYRAAAPELAARRGGAAARNSVCAVMCALTLPPGTAAVRRGESRTRSGGRLPIVVRCEQNLAGFIVFEPHDCLECLAHVFDQHHNAAQPIGYRPASPDLTHTSSGRAQASSCAPIGQRVGLVRRDSGFNDTPASVSTIH